MKVLLSGCNGAMGCTAVDLIKDSKEMSISVGIDKFANENSLFPIFTSYNDCKDKPDVIIDFSHPDTLEPLIAYAIKNHIPAVLCTTGYSDVQIELIKKASRKIPIFRSANMSIGINLVIELIKKASAFLEGFDIEIIEKHHSRKIDSPSGTALMLAEAVNSALPLNKSLVCGRDAGNGKRNSDEIGIHSVRGGTVVGEHEVLFLGNDESVEIKHTAHSKVVFAQGAVHAAAFIVDQKPGLYSMKDMLAL